ncbi:hypothetical protein A4A49_35638 [Nicotiana attenuata]|uniref:Uncharacterized protein n=1 Tax=Nicotiana attenuata TaxID=49451 RepID=A0A1J6K9H2_NICAT|nr:hypothetical protein A4A49_35638 [Nicotiana attenuata]
MSPPVKLLTSGIVVGYRNGRWTEVRDNRPKKNNEAKAKEEKGKQVTNVEHNTSVLVQITNKFALLEEGAIEEVIRVKKEAVLEVENKANEKESKIEWVRRKFGTSKEELKQLNVTVNHSCQEIPSQTFDDSAMNKEINNEVTSTKVLWSDEVDYMEMNYDGSNIEKISQGGGKDNQKADLTTATVNPIGYDKEQPEQAEIIEGSPVEASTRKHANGTVNPRGSVKVFDNVERVPVDFSGGGQDENVNMNVLEDTDQYMIFMMQEALGTMEMNSMVLKEDTRRTHDQIDLAIRACASESRQTNTSNNAIQIVAPAVDNPCILAGKMFSVTSGILLVFSDSVTSVTNGILAKGILIYQRGQKELGMKAKNHEPKPLALQIVTDEQPELEELREDVDEKSTVDNFQKFISNEILSPRSVDKKKSGTKHAKKQKDKIVPVRVQPKRSGVSNSK